MRKDDEQNEPNWLLQLEFLVLLALTLLGFALMIWGWVN